MAQVIRVDPDDELPTILERLPAGAPCVLVLPPHARALNSVVGAKLMARRAATLGSVVAVVSDDHAVLAHVRAAGVLVAGTVDEAQSLLPASSDERVRQSTPGQPNRADRRDDPDDVHWAPTTPLVVADGAAAGRAPDSGPGTASDRTFHFVAGDADRATADDGVDDQTQAAGVRGHSRGARGSTRPPASGTGAGAPAPRVQAQSHGKPIGAGLMRLLTPVALILIPLLLLGAVVSYVLSGLLNPTATLAVQMRPGVVTGSTVVRVSSSIPLKKRDAHHVGMAIIAQTERGVVPLPVRGVQPLPGHVATGAVELGNLTSKPLLVPVGTAFTTAMNRAGFITVRPVTVPAMRATFAVTRYGTASVPVSAAIGGSNGNVPAGAIVNVPASFTGALKVVNPAPTHGGTNIYQRIVAPRDLSAGASRLFGVLVARAHADIARRRGGDLEQNTLSVTQSPSGPRMAPDRGSATLALAVVVRVAYVHRHDLLPAATGALPNAPLIPSSLSWTATWRPDNTILLNVTAHTPRRLDTVALLRPIVGRSRAQADAYLHSRADITAFNLKLSPPWADRLPSDMSHIHLNVQEPQ